MKRLFPDPAIHEEQQRFLALLTPVYADLARFARAMTHSRDEAREVTAETVFRAWDHRASLREPLAFKSYLFTIARRVCRSERKQAERWTEMEQAVLEQRPDHAPTPDARVDVGLLYEALEQLPRAQREAVVLFEITGLALEEIRAIQGGTLSGVKSRVARGRRALARILGASEDRQISTSGTRMSEGIGQ
jgi:RNA polymerase sigma-70 factor (ECF subfamily)